MKRWRGIVGGALTAALLSANLYPAQAAGVLDGFPDAALRSCVSRILALPGSPGPAKVDTVWCDAKDGVVRDLTGLDALTDLKNILLLDSDVKKLDVLEKLPGLNRIGVQSSGSLDLSPLAHLPHLFWLQLYEPSRTDIDFVRSLPAISTLKLRVAPTADLTPVLDMPKLTTLSLSVGPDADVSVLAELPETLSLSLVATGTTFPTAPRTKHLEHFSASGAELRSLDGLEAITATDGGIAGGTLTDISAISSMGFSSLYLSLPIGADLTAVASLTSLRTLILGQQRPASLAPVCRAPQLAKLTLSFAGQKDLAELAGCTTLTELELRANDITDLAPLGKLTALRSLDLSGNKIADVSPLRTLTNLQQLDLSNNQLTRVLALRTLTSLEKVNLDFNEVTDLSPLAGLSTLTSLSATWNPVTTLGPSGSLKNLELLDVTARGQVSTLDALRGTTRLTRLKLAGNLVRDLSPLSEVPDEAELDVRGNQIADFSPLAGWTGTLLATDQLVVLPDAKQAVPYPARLLDHHGKPLTLAPHSSVDYAAGTLTYDSPGFHQNSFWSGKTAANSPISVTLQQSVTEGEPFKVTAKPTIPWANPRIGKPITFVKAPKWSPTPSSITYRWFRDASPISGANAVSYTPIAADAGSSLWVQVTAHRKGYADSVVDSNYTDNVPYRTLKKTPTPKLIYQGKLKAGSILTAKPGTWDAGVTLTYRWQRDRKNIPGATATTYRVTAADAGHKLRVRVRGSKTGYQSTSGDLIVSKYSATVTPAKAKFAASAKPTIIGSRAVGQKLTATVDWTPEAKLTYQWYRNGKKIKGATKASYTLKASDLNDRFSVRVTASTSGYTTVAKTSAKTGKIARGRIIPATVSIGGTPAVGQTLSGHHGVWQPNRITFTYQWYRDGKAIEKATSKTYQVPTAEAGHTLTVRITGARKGYTTVRRTTPGVVIGR